MKLLSDNEISIEYMYAFKTISKQHAYAVIRVEETSLAAEILTRNGIRLLTREDIENL